MSIEVHVCQRDDLYGKPWQMYVFDGVKDFCFLGDEAAVKFAAERAKTLGLKIKDVL